MAELSTVPRNGMAHDAESIVASGQALQMTRTSYVTAMTVQRERDLEKVERRLTQEADLAGEDFYYGWGAGKDRVEGHSVKLALAAARCYGNCAIETLPVQDLPDSWVFTASFIDLETGFTVSRQFRQSKAWTVHGKFDAARKEDIRFQIGQSKAIRNVVLDALPASMLDRAMERAKQGVRGKIDKFIAEKGIAAAQDWVIKALGKQGVKEEQILAKFQIAARNALVLDDLVILRGDLSALESGTDSKESLYPSAAKEAPAERTSLKGKPAEQKPDASQPVGLPGPKNEQEDLERQEMIRRVKEDLAAAKTTEDLGTVQAAMIANRDFLGAAFEELAGLARSRAAALSAPLSVTKTTKSRTDW